MKDIVNIKLADKAVLIDFCIYYEGLNPGKTMSSSKIKELFDIYYQFSGIRERGYFCPSCRARVYKRMGVIYNRIKNELIKRELDEAFK